MCFEGPTEELSSQGNARAKGQYLCQPLQGAEEKKLKNCKRKGGTRPNAVGKGVSEELIRSGKELGSPF